MGKLACHVMALGIVILILKSGQVFGAPSPFLLGNQMTSLAVIPRTEEQAQALLSFLRKSPHYGNTGKDIRLIDPYEHKSEEVIYVPSDGTESKPLYHLTSMDDNGMFRIGVNRSHAYRVSQDTSE